MNLADLAKRRPSFILDFTELTHNQEVQKKLIVESSTLAGLLWCPCCGRSINQLTFRRKKNRRKITGFAVIVEFACKHRACAHFDKAIKVPAASPQRDISKRKKRKKKKKAKKANQLPLLEAAD